MLYRLQVILAHSNALPRDAVTNTFWFEDADPLGSPGLAEEYAEHVRDFYVTARAGQTAALSSYLASSVATNGHSIKVAPIDKETGEDVRGPGQPPLHIETFDLVGRPAPALGMPSEVALCLSFRNTDSGSVPPARKRGRVYYGPIEASATVDRGAGIVTPENGLITNLLQAGVNLRDLAPAAADWVIYSRPFAGRDEIVRPGRPTLPAIPARDGATYVVSQVLVDNAFDTQRRRGERSSARSIL